MFIYGHHKMDSTTLVKGLEQKISREAFKKSPSPGGSKERGRIFSGNKFRLEPGLTWEQSQPRPGIARRTSLIGRLDRERCSGHYLWRVGAAHWR
jgi:hypothetical protein